MDLDQMMKNVKQMSREDLEASKAFYESTPEQEGVVEEKETIDLYERDASARRKESKKRRPNGSASRVKFIAKKIIEGDGSIGLEKTYKKYKDTTEKMKKNGWKHRADIVKRQYMEERFIPSVETIIRYSSPDELLNCRDALSMLDKLAMGEGRMSGYTESYVRSAYGDLLGKDLDGRFNTSDPTVAGVVTRIRCLVGNDNIRAAVGLAEQIKKQIDNGEHIASDDDYSLIMDVANF